MKSGPYYVIETSGIRINPAAPSPGSGSRLEYELLVAGPNGHHAWRRTIPRSHGGHKFTYDERLAHARAAAASVCALLNEEALA